MLGAGAADVRVDLRANAGEIVGAAATADLRGIELRGVRGDAGGAAERVVPWDMVRAVDGSVASAAGADLPTMLEVATELWRARTRVERGDMELARPLFRAQWPRFARAEGPTAALVAEGALRCAVAAGELDAALEPWLECLRHRAAGEATRFPTLDPALDPETGLLPVSRRSSRRTAVRRWSRPSTRSPRSLPLRRRPPPPRARWASASPASCRRRRRAGTLARWPPRGPTRRLR
ncbi:MAG: hypothetical protein ACO3QC_03435 [Phycisphaerales bacterium]